MQHTVDAALTPDVRKFLPTVIDSVHQLKKVAKLEQEQVKIAKTLEERHAKSMQTISEMSKTIQEQLLVIETNSKDDYRNIVSKMSSETNDLLGHINLKLDKIEKERIMDKVDDIKNGVENLISEQSSQFDIKLQNVIQDKKSEIFDAVRAMIPQEEVDFFNIMKGFIPRM